MDFPKGNVLCEARHTDVLTNFCSNLLIASVDCLCWLWGDQWLTHRGPRVNFHLCVERRLPLLILRGSTIDTESTVKLSPPYEKVIASFDPGGWIDDWYRDNQQSTSTSTWKGDCLIWSWRIPNWYREDQQPIFIWKFKRLNLSFLHVVSLCWSLITFVHAKAIASVCEKVITSVSEKVITSVHANVITSACEKTIASACKRLLALCVKRQLPLHMKRWLPLLLIPICRKNKLNLLNFPCESWLLILYVDHQLPPPQSTEAIAFSCGDESWLLILFVSIIDPTGSTEMITFSPEVKVDCSSSLCQSSIPPPAGINRGDCLFLKGESWLLILSVLIIDPPHQQRGLHFHTRWKLTVDP